jgi:predicted DNA-binding protein
VKPTSVRLDEPELERIRRLAKQTRRKQSDLIRYALELGLAEIERQHQNPSPAEEVQTNE